MKSIVHDQLGPADSVLRLADREIPQPGQGEVRIRVAVSGVNPTDWKARTGLYGGEVVESVPNQDGAGVSTRSARESKASRSATGSGCRSRRTSDR